MTPRFNFAPVSSVPSTLLRIASGWFVFNGVFYGLLVSGLILGSLLGKEGFSPTILVVFTILVGVTTAVGLVWTGSLLGRGSRLGGILAFGFVLLPVAFAALARQPMRATDIVFGVLGVIVLLLVWGELR